MDAFMDAGSVEYSREDARIDIDELIAELEQLKEDGVTHVIGLSGNYRGAEYVRLGMPVADDEPQEGECPAGPEAHEHNMETYGGCAYCNDAKEGL